MAKLWHMFLCFLLSLLVGSIRGAVIVTTDDGTEWFSDAEANFGPAIGLYGESGILYVAEPLDACGELSNGGFGGIGYPIALIIRGGCPFDEKVRNAQEAGFRAAVVYNNEYYNKLVAMTGSSKGIGIPAVFVGKASGEALKKYSEIPGTKLTILRNISVPVTIPLISLMFLLVSCTWYCVFKEIQGNTRLDPYGDPVGTDGLGSPMVKAMPSEKFILDLEDNCTSRTCAICYADYEPGDKLRVLPCRHKFHESCVDEWLTKWKSFCPVCKHDVRKEIKSPPASESTPLLSNGDTTSYSTIQTSSTDSSTVATPSIIQTSDPVHALNNSSS